MNGSVCSHNQEKHPRNAQHETRLQTTKIFSSPSFHQKRGQLNVSHIGSDLERGSVWGDFMMILHAHICFMPRMLVVLLRGTWDRELIQSLSPLCPGITALFLVLDWVFGELEAIKRFSLSFPSPAGCARNPPFCWFGWFFFPDTSEELNHHEKGH